MSLAESKKWIRFAILTTIVSVLGGVAGYFLGVWAMDWLQPLIIDWGYSNKFEQVKALFSHWGIWAILAAGFSLSCSLLLRDYYQWHFYPL